METKSCSQLARELGGGPAYRFSAEGRKTRLFINIINDLTQCNYARTWFSHLISSFFNCFRRCRRIPAELKALRPDPGTPQTVPQSDRY